MLEWDSTSVRIHADARVQLLQRRGQHLKIVRARVRSDVDIPGRSDRRLLSDRREGADDHIFCVLAASGLRISEAIALQWRHVRLDGSTPHVKVRGAVVRGTLGPPKTRCSRRDVPLPAELVVELRRLRTDSSWPDDEQLVFPALNRAWLNVSNLR